MHTSFSFCQKNRLFQFVITVFWLQLVIFNAFAQGTPVCNSAANAGSSYETCTSGTCERFVCNGTIFVASQTWNHDGTINIDFGNDTSPCTAERRGRIRFNGVNLWEFCSGTAWESLLSATTTTLNADNALFGRIISIGSPKRNFLSNAGTRNTFLGDNAGGGILTGTDNTFLGYNAGDATTLGSNNIFIGSNTGGLNIASSNNLLIGNNINAPTLLVSSYLNISNVISGYMANNGANTSTSDNSASLAIDGSLKLGTSTELCLPTNGGRMRYNSATRKMQYCNELAWVDM